MAERCSVCGWWRRRKRGGGAGGEYTGRPPSALSRRCGPAGPGGCSPPLAASRGRGREAGAGGGEGEAWCRLGYAGGVVADGGEAPAVQDDGAALEELVQQPHPAACARASACVCASPRACARARSSPCARV